MAEANKIISVTMHPFKQTKAIPELGYIFPCGKPRKITVTPADAVEFVRRSERVVKNAARGTNFSPAHYSVEVLGDSSGPADQKIPQIGWKKQPVQKSAIAQQTDALKSVGEQVASALLEQSKALNALVGQLANKGK